MQKKQLSLHIDKIVDLWYKKDILFLIGTIVYNAFQVNACRGFRMNAMAGIGKERIFWKPLNTIENF